MAADALRQLGDHAGSADLLDFQFPKGYDSHVELIRSANTEGDIRLRQVD